LRRPAAAPGRVALATQPVAIVDASSPVVTACSRAAWARGVRPGMVASVARSHAPELITLVRDPAGEAELLRALADQLLALTPVVDLGGAAARSAPRDAGRGAHRQARRGVRRAAGGDLRDPRPPRAGRHRRRSLHRWRRGHRRRRRRAR
jgi:nucleotidyltransferase/DNA polymerase involved in DNA repair